MRARVRVLLRLTVRGLTWQYFDVFDRLRHHGVLVGEHVWNFADFMTAQVRDEGRGGGLQRRWWVHATRVWRLCGGRVAGFSGCGGWVGEACGGNVEEEGEWGRQREGMKGELQQVVYACCVSCVRSVIYCVLRSDDGDEAMIYHQGVCCHDTHDVGEIIGDHQDVCDCMR